MRARFCISLGLFVLLASYGCGGSAEVEMKQAQQAMDDARNFQADSLAPTDFQQAQKAWDHARNADKQGKTGAAKVLYNSAKIYFGKAADIAQAKHDSLSRALETMQQTISSNLGRVKNDLFNANVSSQRQSQVSALMAEVEEANASISKLVIQKDLPKAVAMAKDVQTKIYHAQLILAGQKPK
jgi:hypothetical protein